jgi:hypothetical protein
MTSIKEKDEARLRKRAEELDNFRLLDVHKWSDYPEVSDAVEHLFGDLSKDPDFEGREDLKKKHIKVIIIGLYANWLVDPDCYTAYYRRVTEYKARSRYNSLHISKKTISVVDALAKRGYIETVIGHYGRTGGHTSHMSRMRANDKLIKLITEVFNFTDEMIEIHPHRECIILRDYNDEKKKQVDIPSYCDNAQTEQMRTDLYAYNNLLRRTFIDIPWFPKEGVLGGSKKRLIKIDRSDKFVRRVFNNSSWELGGRFYGGWWQRLPKEWREKILINNEFVNEIDYSGLHIVLLYAQEGIDYWDEVGEDPYQLGQGYEASVKMRTFLKLLLLTIINAKDHDTAIKSVRWEVNKDKEAYGWINDEGFKLEELVDRFTDYHSPISHHFCSGAGVRLQNTDSIMAEHIINKFTQLDIPVLCVHDSFIIQDIHRDKLHDAMQEAWFEIAEDALKRSAEDINTKSSDRTDWTKEIKDMVGTDGWLNETERLLLTPQPKGTSIPNRQSSNPDGYVEGIDGTVYQTEIIEDQEYLSRWKRHQSKEWEGVYYRLED